MKSEELERRRGKQIDLAEAAEDEDHQIAPE
jgi:hypothetical protein